MAALVAHRFLRAGSPPRRLTLVARAGGVVLLGGVALGVGRWLADGGLQRTARPASRSRPTS